MQRVLDLWRDDTAQPIGDQDAYILGVRFPIVNANTEEAQFSPEFRQEVRKLLWLMYRTQFPTPIPRDPGGPSPLLQNVNAFFRSGPNAIQTSNLLDSFTSDVGWGCMIRTGQSLLANALVRLAELNEKPKKETGKDPKVPADNDSFQSNSHAVGILRKFSDEPTSPYSIHRFVSYGAKHCGKLPGQWFGPSAVAACIAEFAKPQLSTYISQGMDIYESELRESRFPVLISCNLRLGIHEINPIYYEGLRALLTNKYSVGIAGGRTSASHYFYGVQGTQLFFHDPHEPKQALTSESTDEDILNSLANARSRASDVKEMDPSMLVGFLLPSLDDVVNFIKLLKEVPYQERILHISQQKPSIESLHLDEDSGDEQELKSNRDNSEATDCGYVVCSTPEPEVPEPVEAKEPADESLTEIKSDSRNIHKHSNSHLEACNEN